MEGYLEKKKLGRKMSGFKLRYCKLGKGKLQYYGTREEMLAKAPPKGELSLLDMDLACESLENPCQLSVRSSSQDWLYSFRLQDESERDAWVAHLQVWMKVTSLQDHIPIPTILANGILVCLEFCSFYAQDIEGLFRVPGNGSTVNEIFHGICRYGDLFLTHPHNEIRSKRGSNRLSRLSKISTFSSQDASHVPLYDSFDVGSTVKLALRNLPETLLTNALFDEFMACEDAESMAQVVQKLPSENCLILKSVMEVTLMMWQNEETTKMDPGKVSICLSPNLIPRRAESNLCDMSTLFFEMSGNINTVFEGVDVPRFFPEDFWDYLVNLES